MGYTRDVIKGISWLGSFRVITRGMSFVRTAFIARLLSPSQFGIYAIAALILSLIDILTETGINIFLVQKKDQIDKYINTAWIISITRGVFMFILLFLSAPLVADFFSEPNVQPLIVLVSVVPLIRGFINPSVAKFIKELQFQKEFGYRTSIFFVESLVTLMLAFLTKSESSLIWGLIIGAVYEVVSSFIIAGPRPNLAFDLHLCKEILNKGKWMTASGIFNYLYHHGDDAVIAKILGSSTLGLYDMAYRISMLPLSEISDTIGKATFPVYVKIADDTHRLRVAFFKSIMLISAIVIPMGSIFFFFPREIISLVLGPQWIGAASVLQVLAIFGVIRAISISVIAPLYGLGKQEVVTQITFISLLGLSITIVPLVQRYGMLGGAYAAIFGAVIVLPVIIYHLTKLLVVRK